MPRAVLIDELQITVTGSAKLTSDQIEAIRRALLSRRFMAELKQAVVSVFQRQPSLEPLKVRVSR